MSEIADAKMIQELKEAALAATPGPWEAQDSMIFNTHEGRHSISRYQIAEVCGFGNDDDAAHIAAANPTAILALIAKVERLEKEADYLAGRAANSIEIQYKAYGSRQHWRNVAREAVAEQEAKNPSDHGK